MLTLPLRKELFWDIDIKTIDEKRNKRLIIERVFSYGNLDELKTLINHYGRNTIKSGLSQVGYLDPKTFEFVISFFGLHKEKMKCYLKRRFQPQHWN